MLKRSEAIVAPTVWPPVSGCDVASARTCRFSNLIDVNNTWDTGCRVAVNLFWFGALGVAHTSPVAGRTRLKQRGVCMKWVGFLLLQLTGVFAFQTEVVLPWATFNETFTTQVTLDNPSNRSARATVTLHRAGDAAAMVAEVLVNPLEQRHLNVDQIFPELSAGSGFNLRFSSPNGELRVSMVVHATTTTSGVSPAQMNAVAVDEAANILMFSNLTHGENDFSAPVVMNLGDQPAEVTFYPYSGGRIGTAVTRTVAAGASVAATMQDLFPEEQGSFYVVARAEQPLLGTSFFFNNLREPSTAPARALSSLPRIDSGATISTLAQNAGFVDALTQDAEGNIYVSDFFGGGNFNDIRGTDILKVSPDGDVSVYATGFSGPLGQAWDSQGNLYVSNWLSGDIRRVTPAGDLTVFATGFSGPSGLAFDPNGNLIVSSYRANTLHRVSPDGSVAPYVSDLNGPVGIVYDEDGVLYVANYNDGKIFAVDGDGAKTEIAQIRGPRGFTIGYLTYAKGDLYATGIGDNKIYKVTRDGEVSVFIGTGAFNLADGDADSAILAAPNGISASHDGESLIITSFAGRAVRLITIP